MARIYTYEAHRQQCNYHIVGTSTNTCSTSEYMPTNRNTWNDVRIWWLGKRTCDFSGAMCRRRNVQLKLWIIPIKSLNDELTCSVLPAEQIKTATRMENTLVGTLTFDLRKNFTFAGTSKNATRRNIFAAWELKAIARPTLGNTDVHSRKSQL